MNPRTPPESRGEKAIGFLAIRYHLHGHRDIEVGRGDLPLESVKKCKTVMVYSVRRPSRGSFILSSDSREFFAKKRFRLDLQKLCASTFLRVSQKMSAVGGKAVF